MLEQTKEWRFNGTVAREESSQVELVDGESLRGCPRRVKKRRLAIFNGF